MLNQLFLSLALSAVSGHTVASEVKPWTAMSDLKCQKEFEQMAQEKGWDKENYREQVASSFKKTAYRNLSTKIGEWVEVQLVSKSSPEVLFVQDNAMTRFSFDKNCKVVTKNEAWPWHVDEVFGVKTPEDWSNEDLRTQVASGKKGMIYYWSPRFSYSVYDLPRVEKLAKEFGYEFIPVVDPRASKAEVMGALDVMYKKTKIKKIRKLASAKEYNRNVAMDLYMRSAFNHFPIVYVYNNNKIHSRWITGIMTDKGLQSMAETFSSELK